jgi:hypothetical protein
VYNNKGCAPGNVLPLLRSSSKGVLDYNHCAHQDTDLREESVLHQHGKPDTLFRLKNAR